MVRRQKRIPRSRFPKNDFEICCQNAAKREESGSAKLLILFGGPGRDRTDDLFHAME